MLGAEHRYPALAGSALGRRLYALVPGSISIQVPIRAIYRLTLKSYWGQTTVFRIFQATAQRSAASAPSVDEACE